MNIEVDGKVYSIDPGAICDISIPLRFNGDQPNAFSVAPAVSEAVKAGSLIGDTRREGSVNFETYTFIPHCNGTHTECVGHITDERISVRSCLRDALIPAQLISVLPSGEVITRLSLEGELNGMDDSALVIRTLPNDDSKLTRTYGEHNIPPYFEKDAMELIVKRGVKHLLIDVPSIDRIFDEGKLVNHRLFWNVEPASRVATTSTRREATITEMIYVPNEVEDGEYLLNLQIAPFESDCAPSRPVLFRSVLKS